MVHIKSFKRTREILLLENTAGISKEVLQENPCLLHVELSRPVNVVFRPDLFNNLFNFFPLTHSLSCNFAKRPTLNKIPIRVPQDLDVCRHRLEDN